MCWHMMFFSLLLASASLPLMLCHPSPRSRSAPRQNGPTYLYPMSLSRYEEAMGLRRRAHEEFSHLDPADQARLIYGHPGNNGQGHMADMTLYAEEGLPIVLLERFDDLTSKVDCKGDDGTMSLTFNSKEAYNHAMTIWSKINEDDAKQFLVIANHDGCGPDDKRQPYKVSSVEKDSADLTVKMSSKVAEWEEVTGSYELHFGQFDQAQKIKARGFFGDLGDVLKGAYNAYQGKNVEWDASKSIEINIGDEGKPKNIFHDDDGHLSIDCDSCYIKSKWLVHGYIRVDKKELQELTIELSPEEFDAKLEVSATIDYTGSNAEPIQHEEELDREPVPWGGLDWQLGSVGATVSAWEGARASISGKAKASFKVEGKIPKEARIFADIVNPSRSAIEHWNESTINHSFEVEELSASIDLAAYMKSRLSLGIESKHIGKWETSFVHTYPERQSSLTATYDEKGVCHAGGSKTGVKAESNKYQTYSFEIQMDWDTDDQKPEKEWELKKDVEPLKPDCFEVKIPGLEPTDHPTTASSIPLLTATAPMATGTGLYTAPMATGTGFYDSGNVKPRAAPPPKCYPPGKTGNCQSTNQFCAGDYISGYCPGEDAIQCCPEPSGWR